MKFIEVIFVVVVVLTGTCCSQPEFCNRDRALRMTKNQINFALKLFKHSSPANESNLLSPFAIISALSILYQGAAGQSAQIFDNYPYCVIHYLNSDEGNNSIVGGSSRLWAQLNFLINPSFQNIISMLHSIKIKHLNFSHGDDDSLVEAASQWLFENDYGRANNVIFINFGFSLFLISELHLKLEWKYRFSLLNHQTRFILSPSQVIQVFGLTAIEKQLTGAKLFNYMTAVDASNNSIMITVTIPKIFARKYISLSDGFESIGLLSMFTELANFSVISDQPLSMTKYIGNLASIQITESGININYTDSSAANSNDGRSTLNDDIETINPLPESQLLHADHCFIYLLCDNQKNILFIGRYMPDEKDDEFSGDCNDTRKIEKSMEKVTIEGDDEFSGDCNDTRKIEKSMEKVTIEGDDEFSGDCNDTRKIEKSMEKVTIEGDGEFSGYGDQKFELFSEAMQPSEYDEFGEAIEPLEHDNGAIPFPKYSGFSGLIGEIEISKDGDFIGAIQTPQFGKCSEAIKTPTYQEYNGAFNTPMHEIIQTPMHEIIQTPEHSQDVVMLQVPQDNNPEHNNPEDYEHSNTEDNNSEDNEPFEIMELPKDIQVVEVVQIPGNNQYVRVVQRPGNDEFIETMQFPQENVQHDVMMQFSPENVQHEAMEHDQNVEAPEQDQSTPDVFDDLMSIDFDDVIIDDMLSFDDIMRL
ncbi:hypothetical protein DINM_003797 [Dirofilaria immitis]|nr:hypothetical protein [Dirofilaria immitis]